MVRTSGLTIKRREPKKGASFEKRDHRETPGRSRGSYGTKVCVIADGHGKAFGFALAPGRLMNCLWHQSCLTAFPPLPCGSWRTGATRQTPFVNGYGTWEPGSPFLRNDTMGRSPAPNESIGAGISLRTSGLASRDGALSQPDTKKQQRRSSRSSTSLPQQTGSSPNRP
ncbi:transposase [Komagataeibacter medellinensis NBRC 3288]|uniref:Transposase n=1 Tax=Komagataeibacter medellinensis (strain NBRC 3288 / BCRC 11682 / LMG 1693 / Kondo 51) TaxID=634177 RepID=G2I2F4_KOMMN|nr:transposase [Komagataeibacter medellinensis NBRC 3288]